MPRNSLAAVMVINKEFHQVFFQEINKGSSTCKRPRLDIEKIANFLGQNDKFISHSLLTRRRIFNRLFLEIILGSDDIKVTWFRK